MALKIPSHKLLWDTESGTLLYWNRERPWLRHSELSGCGGATRGRQHSDCAFHLDDVVRDVVLYFLLNVCKSPQWNHWVHWNSGPSEGTMVRAHVARSEVISVVCEVTNEWGPCGASYCKAWPRSSLTGPGLAPYRLSDILIGPING